jgi:N-dimethylarginine dimethylaminohydrolase
MVGRLRRVLVARPAEAFGSADPRRWHYTGAVELREAQREHDRLVEIVAAAGAEICPHDADAAGSADAIYVHDPCIVTDAGAVLLNMGKEGRKAEPAAVGATLERLGVPLLARLEGQEHAEGGDLLWLDARTLAVGIGFRTNAAGAAGLRRILAPAGVEVVEVPLPYFEGPEACLHLMSVVSVVDRELAVVYPRLLPVPFWSRLRDAGFRLVEVPDEELATMGANVLALAPGHAVMLEGNPRTRASLERAGCRVDVHRGREISLKAEGGATCLTRPILRDPA